MDGEQVPSVMPTEMPVVTWTASEFVAHEKTNNWYMLLGGGSVLVAIVVWLITRDVVSSLVILFAAFVFGFYARRQPRELTYRLDEQGLTIGDKFYHYDTFRAFSVVPEGALNTIVLSPLKRFAPLTTLYYDPADQEKITALLANELPFEQRKQDPIDRLMWRIRF